MRELSDEQLMLEYAAGSAPAFDELYARHRGPLYRYILRQVNDPTIANDLYQGSWEKIIKARHSYRQASPFRGWMYRITRNHVIDHFRRLPPSAEDLDQPLADAAPGPEEQFETERENHALNAAIAGLPADQREALLLRLEGGLNLAGIAEVTGVSRETAKSRLRYAVQKLQPLMEERETIPGPDHG